MSNFTSYKITKKRHPIGCLFYLKNHGSHLPQGE